MNPYQVLGSHPVIMRGRQDIFYRLTAHLTKATPDHVSVVGPKHIGKSVLLKRLASNFSESNGYYLAALYWDLRHGTPDSDAAFKKRLAEEVKKALEPVYPDLAMELRPGAEDIGPALATVFDILQEEKKRLLAVLDGFDRVLATARLTRNLWDYLLNLANRSSLRLVTGSRQRLQKLCKTEESSTSDFWEIFYDTPLKVGPFTERDWDGLLAPFTDRAILFDGSARKELINWTGGVPVLTAALLARLYNEIEDGRPVSKPDIDSLSESVLNECQDTLGGLWEDCTVETQCDLGVLADGQDLPANEIPVSRCRSLEERGYGHASGNRLKPLCRIMQRYAKQHSSGIADLRRLFGDSQRFDENIRSLLEIRHNHVPKFDQKLLDYVERAIRDLLPHPEDSIAWMRRIAERALDIIWGKELPPDRSIPQEWLEEWKYAGAKYKDMERRILPGSRGTQCFILRLMTGTKIGEKEIRAVARYTSKATQLLADHIQSVGDFGQHIENNRVILPFAVSVCLSAIALCESLAEDMSKQAPN